MHNMKQTRNKQKQKSIFHLSYSTSIYREVYLKKKKLQQEKLEAK